MNFSFSRSCMFVAGGACMSVRYCASIRTYSVIRPRPSFTGQGLLLCVCMCVCMCLSMHKISQNYSPNQLIFGVGLPSEMAIRTHLFFTIQQILLHWQGGDRLEHIQVVSFNMRVCCWNLNLCLSIIILDCPWVGCVSVTLSWSCKFT